MSRGKLDNKIYFAGPRPVDEEHHLPKEQAPSQDDQWKLIKAGLGRDRSKELASQVIAALDRDDKPAAVAVLEEATKDSKAMAQWAREREAAEASEAATAKAAREEAAAAKRSAAAVAATEAKWAKATPAERAAEAQAMDVAARQRMLAEDAAKTPGQRKAEQDTEYAETHQEQDRGMQRTL